MAYQKKFTKPFPGGYRDFPDESTIITASVMDNYDQTLEDFDTEFETVDGKLEKLKGVDNLKSAFKFDESGNPTGVEVTGDVVANGVSLIETKEAVSANEANISDINSSLTNVESRVTSVEKKATDNAGEIARVDGSVSELKSDLETESSNSKKAIAELNDKKITKFYANNLGETTLQDSDNGKIVDMFLYGKSEQNQYSGKNLLNTTLGTTTLHGVTCTNNGDGTYTLNGTAKYNTFFNVGKINANNLRYKMVGCPSGGDYHNRYALYFDKDGIESTKIIDDGNGVTFEANGTQVIYIKITKGFNANNLLFKPMITTDTSLTSEDFEPYVGGIPSPNPDYPQEIRSVVNPLVKVCGKNLWKYDSKYEVVGYINNLSDIFIEKGKTYTINVNQSSRWLYQISPSKEDSDADGNYYVMVISSATATFTSQIDGYLYLRVVDPSVKENIQVEFGEIATDYEPYKEQTVSLPYTMNAIPVSSGGNVTIDGQQYIADYVDIERKKIHRLVDSSKLDPTVSIIDNSNWLLSADEVIDITDEEVQAFKELATYYHTTNVMVTSEQLDGYTIFNYPISMENGWNYVKQQIGDTRDYIYDMELQSAEAYVNSEYAVALAELGV